MRISMHSFEPISADLARGVAARTEASGSKSEEVVPQNKSEQTREQTTQAQVIGVAKGTAFGK